MSRGYSHSAAERQINQFISQARTARDRASDSASEAEGAKEAAKQAHTQDKPAHKQRAARAAHAASIAREETRKAVEEAKKLLSPGDDGFQLLDAIMADAEAASDLAKRHAKEAFKIPP
ncbi:MAG: hypothetical protein AAB408_03365 [Patescibacteria group bacterium]